MRYIVVLGLGSVRACGTGEVEDTVRFSNTPCGRYCEARDTHLKAQIFEGVDGFTQLTCETLPEGVEGCERECIESGASEACLACGPRINPGCNETCRPNSPSDAQYFLGAAYACWEGAKPEQACVAANAERLALNSGGSDYSFVGTATVSTVSPLRVQAEGRTWELPSNTLSWTPSQTVQFAVEQICPWWCTTSFTIRDAQDNLLFAGWQGRPGTEIMSLGISYEVASCVGGPVSEYIRAIDLTLVVGESRIAPGSSAVENGFRYTNGASARHYVVLATDTPSQWQSGTIERLP